MKIYTKKTIKNEKIGALNELFCIFINCCEDVNKSI